jgi:hypothetical protein
MAAPLHADRDGGLRDIGRRLDHLPVGHFHRRVVVAVGLGLFFEVYEIFLSSTIATALRAQYGLDGTALQLLLASSFLGMFVGARHSAGSPIVSGADARFCSTSCGSPCRASSAPSRRIRGSW